MMGKWATWTMTRQCRAVPRCAYCIQGKADPEEPPRKEELFRIIDGINRLPGEWDLSLLGGEIFDMEDSEQVLAHLCRSTRHRISFTSNFIVSNQVLGRLLEEHPSSIREMRFSFHAGLWPGVAAFFSKLDELVTSNAFQRGGSRVKVAIPLIPRYFRVIAEQLVPGLKEREVDYFFQFLKVAREGQVTAFHYTPEQAATLKGLVAEVYREKQVVRPNCHLNQLCRAGSRLLSIQPNGDVYACYNYYDARDPKGFLGNLRTSEVRLLQEPIRCIFSHCGCGAADYAGMLVEQ